MRFPRPLPEGGTVDVVAPAFGAAIEPYASALANAERILRDGGYRVREWPCVHATDGVGISSVPAVCARELEDAWCDPCSDVLLSCGGGELMCETVGHVDMARVAAAEPKWFMGYSDNTNFSFALATLADVASVYGPCAPAFGMEPWHESLTDAWAVLSGEDPAAAREGGGAAAATATEASATAPAATYTVAGYDAWQIEGTKDEEHPLEPYNVTEAPCATAWGPAIAECSLPAEAALAGYPASRLFFSAVEGVSMHGRLLGGCLDVLANLCGTPLDGARAFNERYAGDGVVWCIEACDFGPMAVRRALWQLANAGWFEQARGFVFGRPGRFGDEEMGLTFADAVLGALAEAGLSVPVILDADLGHLPPAMPLVMGSLADVSFADGRTTVRMGFVS